MCSKCRELDRKIEYYRQMAGSLDDEIMLEGMSILIAKYHGDKQALHPETPLDWAFAALFVKMRAAREKHS